MSARDFSVGGTLDLEARRELVLSAEGFFEVDLDLDLRRDFLSESDAGCTECEPEVRLVDPERRRGLLSESAVKFLLDDDRCG